MAKENSDTLRNLNSNRKSNLSSKLKSKRDVKDLLFKYSFALPALLFVLIFMIYPIIYNVIISFQDVTIANLRGDRAFVGIQNYIDVITNSTFLIALRNTLIYTSSSIIFQFTIGLLLALFFNQVFPFRNFLRSMLLLAWMTPLVITGTLFRWLLDVDYGFINYFLIQLNFIDSPVNWLGQQSTALASVIFTNIWIGIPFNMILLLAALQSLPKDVYEAARIDGASKIKSFISITLPLLRPQILVILVLGIIYTFKVFDIILVMTRGGPVNATQVLPFFGYELAFVSYEFSLSGAVSTIILFILTIVALIYLYLIRKEEAN